MLCFVIVCIIVIFYALPKILKSYNGRCYSGACLVGKTALVTGGNSGLGYEIVLNLASRGCRVIVADVDDSEGTRVKIIEETNNPNIISMRVDLASLKSVRDFCKEFISKEPRLDLLFNNAGCAGFAGEYTEDGLLKVAQINHFGHFLLTHLLIDLLKLTKNGRIIFTSSIAAFTHSMKSPEDLNLKTRRFIRTFNISSEYANSKLAMVACARVFARKLKDHGILCFSTHPGTVNSNLFTRTYNSVERKSVALFLYYIGHYSTVYFFGKNVEEGAQTALHCALSKDLESDSGKFFADCKPFWFPPTANDDVFCEGVYKISEILVNLKDDEKLY